MRRTYLFVGLIGACAVAAVVVLWTGLGQSQPVRSVQPSSPSAALPLAQVVLFNNGIGYFQREGEIDGTARVDLTFPTTDVNDLIRSLVLQDASKGTVSAISYDGQEPIDRALRSFSLDLAYNPTFGQLLNQARGEKVEVTRLEAGATSTLTGTIVGMESEQPPNGREEHSLNVLAVEGLRRVPLPQVQRVRFLNPTLEAEFRRALEVLAGAHNSQRRTVSLHVKGEAKRQVKLGYVVENPIWKATYRLVLAKKGQPTLQGWAIVENTSDEDWKDVRMALVSGRPFSFQMNLYSPVFVPRPTIEPEMLASLRPPIYQSSQGEEDPGMPRAGGTQIGRFGGGQQIGQLGQIGQIGQFGGAPSNPLEDAGTVGPRSAAATGASGFNRYQTGPGSPGFMSPRAPGSARLSYEQLIERRQTAVEKRSEAREKAREMGRSIAEGLSSLPVEDESGDTYKYTLDQKVYLPRQKSALLPVLHEGVQVTRLSIYNSAIHAKFPLLGLKLKNTTGQPLMQGPLAVFEGGAFAGDCRMPDLKPNEERLLSYALDLGLEMSSDDVRQTRDDLSVAIHDGLVVEPYRERSVHVYRVRNRAKEDRLLLVSHPIHSGWNVIGKEQPAWRSRDIYRFEWKAPAGKTTKFEVVEECRSSASSRLSSLRDEELNRLIASRGCGEKVQAALLKVRQQREELKASTLALTKARAAMQEITQEQARVRANIGTVPLGSAPHDRYVEKFDQLEMAWEKARAAAKEKETLHQRLEKAHQDFVAKLSVK